LFVDDEKKKKWKRFLKIVENIVSIIVFPVFLVGMAMLVPNLALKAKTERYKNKRKTLYTIRFFLFIIGVILCPLTFVIGIIPFTYMGVKALVQDREREKRERIDAQWRREVRERRRKERERMLKERDERFRKEEEVYKNYLLSKEKKENYLHTDQKKPYESLREPLLQDAEENSIVEGKIVIGIY